MGKKKTRKPATSKLIKRMKSGYLLTLKKDLVEKYESPESPLAGPTREIKYMPYPYPYPPQTQPKPEDEKKKKPVSGIDISTDISKPTGFIPMPAIRNVEKRDIAMRYPLIPRNPTGDEPVYAYADIRWDSKLGELVYYLIEPNISRYDAEVIERTKNILEERLDIDFFKLGEIKAKDHMREETEKILRLDSSISPEKRKIIRYYLERDIVGLGKIEPIMKDPHIEDISCDGVNIPIYIYHRDPNLGSMKTNIVFTSDDELNSFVVKMAQRSKKSISIAEPLLDAALPQGSRIQATLGTDIARKGSNFTIRMFAEEPLTPTHMLNYGTLNSIQMAYLWLAIENGQSMLISGGTATGKTSMLNALSLFIRPALKIVSIEDTPELRLPHPHWIPEVARTPLSIKGSVGEVTLFDLLKSSLRQRPDYIVMGEVRGREAFVLFQQMATGHPSLATIHAASINQLVDRLTTPPISLPPSLIENVNIIIFLSLSRIEDRYVRRAGKILEISGIKDDRPLTNDIFTWNPERDEFKTNEKSIVLREIANRQALSEEELKTEILRRKKVLEWMFAQNIYDYREVARIISSYYNNPARVMNVVEERL